MWTAYNCRKRIFARTAKWRIENDMVGMNGYFPDVNTEKKERSLRPPYYT